MACFVYFVYFVYFVCSVIQPGRKSCGF